MTIFRRETRIDLADRLLHLGYYRSGFDAALRFLIATRRRITFAFVQVMFFCLDAVTASRLSFVAAIDAHEAGGANDLFLTASGTFSFPSLVAVAADLAKLPKYRDAVAIIVPDRDTEIALSAKAGSARVINVQRYWLDQKRDIAIHETAYSALSALREACRAATKGDESSACSEMFETIFLGLHSLMIRNLRVTEALQEARRSGARIVVLLIDGNLEFMANCYDALVQAAPQPDIPLMLTRFRTGGTFVPVTLRADLSARLVAARAHLGRYTSAPSISAKGTDKAAVEETQIALVTGALPSSIYWQAALNFAEMACREKIAMRVLVSHGSAARKLRHLGCPIEIASSSIGQTSGAQFAEAYGALLELFESFTTGSRPTDLVERAAKAIEWTLVQLTSSRFIDLVGYRAFRSRSDMRRWLAARSIRAVVVVPHWSDLGWPACNAARDLRLPTASAPAVTVAGNRASIVRWDKVDLIGCYGLQCEAAFRRLGYPAEKLAVVGNMTLDHAFSRKKADARRAIKALRHLDTGRKLVLFATSGINKQEKEILAAIGGVCADQATNAHLVLRPHPSIGRRGYLAMTRELPEHTTTIITDGSVHDAIIAADVVITDFSTVGAEAVLLDRPLLVVNLTGAPFPANNYAELGVAVQASSVEDVGTDLRRLLSEGTYWPDADASRIRFIEAYNWGGDGQASRRFADAVARLASEAVRG